MRRWLLVLLFIPSVSLGNELERHAFAMEDRYGVPKYLLASICKVESNWNNVPGKAKEIGVCQIKLSTAKKLAPVPHKINRPYLAVGSTGKYVKELQVLLEVYPSGEYDQHTKELVRGYQESHHLLVDGVVGPQTWGSLLGSPTLEEQLWDPKTNIEYAAKELRFIIDLHQSYDPIFLACLYNAGAWSKWCSLDYMTKVNKELNKHYSAEERVHE